MNFLSRRQLLTLLPSCCVPGWSRAAEASIVLVGSERGGAYDEAADALVAELGRAGAAHVEVIRMTAAELVQAGALTPRLFVALGLEACRVVLRRESRIPILCTLLPRMGFERLLVETGRKASGQLSALYLTQPLTRQLDLLRLALPQVRRLGVLWGPESRAQMPELEALARNRGLKVNGAQVEVGEPVFGPLKKILDESDLLLALADPQVYHGGSIQNILLTSFRARVPMLAFSPAYVRAGALLAVYSSPAQIGRQAGALARGVLQGQPLGAPLHAQDFSVSVNEHVARSLGLELDAQALTERLRRLERGS